MLNTIKLNHTMWYDGKDKFIQMNFTGSKKNRYNNISLIKSATLKKLRFSGDVFVPQDRDGIENISINVSENKNINIILHTHENFNADGEIIITLDINIFNGPIDQFNTSYYDEIYTIVIIVPTRSHDAKSLNLPLYYENKVTKAVISNDMTKIGTDEDPITYIFDVINMDVTDEYATYGEVLDLIKSESNSDFSFSLENDNLKLMIGNRSSVINLAKYRDESTNTILNVDELKRDIMNEINPRLLDKDTFKQEILQALPTIPNYTLTLNENTLTLGKEGDSEYSKTIDLSKYVNGPAVDAEQLKRDIISAIHVPDEATIKQNILAEVNPKLIDKDAFKQEILSALPAKDEYSLELMEDTLVLTKINDSSYRKEINLAKYHDEVGQPINVESLKSDILSQVDTKISAIPQHVMTANEILDTLSYYGTDGDVSKMVVLAGQILIALSNTNKLVFNKTDTSYEIYFDVDGNDGPVPRMSDPILTIPFTSLREIPTTTQSESITIEKILELLKDESKADVLVQIKEKLGIQAAPSPSKLVSSPSVTNGILKFNIESDAPTVDFTNEFYTKAKIDELLRSSSNPNIPNNKLISGSGRPDNTDHPNNNSPTGTIFIDVNTTNGASVWYRNINKWEVIVGDTGWKRLNAINLFAESGIFIRRINNIVYIKFGGLEYDLFGHVALQNAISIKDTNYIRLVEVNNIPEGFRTDNAYVGTSISDYITPGKILGSYYVSPQSDSNYIKLFYNESVPKTDQKDLRLQPGTWPIGNSQPWPTL